MPKKKPQSVHLAFTNAECRRIIKKTGIKRVSQDAAIALNKLLTYKAREIAAGAVTRSRERNSQTVSTDDITYAVRMGSPVAGYQVESTAPVVHYVWFISSAGTCLLSRSYSGLKFPDTIFAGLVTGIVDLMAEVTGRLIDKITTDELVIHIRRIGEMTVAVICDSEQTEPIDELTDLLALRFSEVFTDEITQEVIDTSIFEDFTPVLDALVSGAGLNIPKERIKVKSEQQLRLTDRQLEATVDAAALRQELLRAQESIQDLGLFRKEFDEDDPKASDVDLDFDESPDVSEIKAVLRQASMDIRQEMGTNNEISEVNEVSSDQITSDEIRNEVAKDLSEIIHIEAEEVAVQEPKKPKKKRTRKRRKRK
ncbi:MAG: histone [Candidatus Hodarchaeales archaeon]|jgi:histone H3/H4